MDENEQRAWEDAYRHAEKRELLTDAYLGDDDPDWDGDICPNCGRDTTIRIDIIADEPTIWIATCATCGEDFEVVTG